MTTSLIERQLPVSILSAECFAERSSKEGQPLTALGKWWGRKPLALIRALIIGLLQPATGDDAKDRETFLRLLTMDADGRRKRCLANGNIPAKELWPFLTDAERTRVFTTDSTEEKTRWKPKKSCPDATRQAVQATAFGRMPHRDQLRFMLFADQIDGPSAESWTAINAHCGTTAGTLSEWIEQMSLRRFGHHVIVGDAFCGGGSIPFAAARIGCQSFGSDLNPAAALFTWGGIHLVGGGQHVIDQARQAMAEVFTTVEHQIGAWGIEHHGSKRNFDGTPWRADMYLYCTEVTCPACGWSIPLSPNWVVAEQVCVAHLIPDPERRRFTIDIREGTTSEAVRQGRQSATVKDSSLLCPNPKCHAFHQSMPISDLRQGLRMWGNNDLAPRSSDVLRERLYAIRWVERFQEEDSKGELVVRERWHYASPTDHDLLMEERSLNLMQERLADWQSKGFVPSSPISPGDKTDEPIRTRGFTHWHHLFHPRQLLILGSLAKAASSHAGANRAALLTALAKAAHYASRLSVWLVLTGKDEAKPVFINQAFNTLYNYALRGTEQLGPKFMGKIPSLPVATHNATIQVADARAIEHNCDLWITDPPYADAVSYHELSEFFIAWFGNGLEAIDPTWVNDSRRPLAIKGSGAGFRQAMADAYRNLANHMPDDGMQVVMFTHQDSSVWADLAIILWAAGLHVSAAWCVSTETISPLKEGNFVQGTVLLILRKRLGNSEAYLDELVVPVEEEVNRQLDAMRGLDDYTSPMFTDADYQLAAYAAALRVLTQYSRIGGIDIAREMHREGGENPITRFVDLAVRLVADVLVPKGLDTQVWKDLKQEERFYLKSLQAEKSGAQQVAVYQELARGFGCHDYKTLMASTKANAARLKTASEFTERLLGHPGDLGFPGQLTRHLLSAIRATVLAQGDPAPGKLLFTTTYGPAWWGHRVTAIAVLDLLATQAVSCPHWVEDSAAAKALAGALRIASPT